eukprot:351215-Chlamydomonas_euryale.AAC.4
MGRNHTGHAPLSDVRDLHAPRSTCSTCSARPCSTRLCLTNPCLACSETNASVLGMLELESRN